MPWTRCVVTGLAWGCLGWAQAVERVQPGDATLSCTALAAEQSRLAELVRAGSGEKSAGTAAAGVAANVGGQLAVGQAASGMLGALGGFASRLAGVAAQGAVEKQLGPDEATRQTGVLAAERQAFLSQLAQAKRCDTPGAEGVLSPEAFQSLVEGKGSGTFAVAALTPDAVRALPAAEIQPLPADHLLTGKIDVADKTLHLSEFRVLFDVGGEVTGGTRAGYLFGTNYGNSRVTVTYRVPQVDVAAYQAITDRALEDFKSRLAAAGLRVVYTPPEGGGVYEPTETASLPGAPVFTSQSYGYGKRQLLVMAPTGMKTISRGIAGIGAGHIGRRIDWSKKGWDGMSVTHVVNIAEMESSGSRSSILSREASADASARLSVGHAPGEYVVQMHVGGGLLHMKEGVVVPGEFAQWRTVKTYDSRKDMAMVALGALRNSMGQAQDTLVRVEKEVDLNGPVMARLALQGMATVNQAIASRLQAR
ncbi:hypothetical protein [Aquabacterium sp. A08]|uniref:hypothetical protein n=1 Tax=Aquabacterium sp. A08 TaxID=2718532 RepID=UPI001420444D|nr:hypothetical protein [Aquabacterium sp. A08]NIC42391.1 hypothetical protein [Aquabacterium sp. A08]